MIVFSTTNFSNNVHNNPKNNETNHFKKLFDYTVRRNDLARQGYQNQDKKTGSPIERNITRDLSNKGLSKTSVRGRQASIDNGDVDKKVLNNKNVAKNEVGKGKSTKEQHQSTVISEEDIELLSQVTGINIRYIEQLLNTEQQRTVDKEIQSDLTNIGELLTAVKESPNISLQSKITLLNKLQRFLDNVDTYIIQQNSPIHQQIGEILGHLKQQVAGIKQDIEGLTVIHKGIGEGIENTAENLAWSKVQMNMSQNANHYADNLTEEPITVAETKSSQKNMDKNGDDSDQSNQKHFTFASKVKIVNLQNRNVNQQPIQLPFNELVEAKHNNASMESVKNQLNMTNINRENVMKQVVESAKVVLTDDKSEMVLQLKPDNLGKISLQIVTERGLMVAKFTAESQQVKEIIESNLAQLKDALESQGLNVKGFSVSVGDDDARRQAFERANSERSSKMLKINTQDEPVVAPNYVLDNAASNLYHISDASIDFTA
jgi:flagellar hook-length control protein FliK